MWTEDYKFDAFQTDSGGFLSEEMVQKVYEKMVPVLVPFAFKVVCGFVILLVCIVRYLPKVIESFMTKYANDDSSGFRNHLLVNGLSNTLYVFSYLAWFVCLIIPC